MNRRSAELPSGRSHPTKIPKRMRIHHVTDLENNVEPLSSYSISNDILFPKFPIEVVAHIFKFMSLRERLNASLVCREWHEAGSFSFHSRNEKLVFYGRQDFEKIFLILSKTKRKFLNLEFHNCIISSFNLWLIADKIRYLSFISCEFSFTLTEIFVKCLNLNEVYFKAKYYNAELINKLIRKSLKQLQEAHFVSENLTTFRVNTTDLTCLTHLNVQSIFKMFPNIKNLSFRALSSSSRNFSTPVVVSLEHNLENLKLDLTYSNICSLMLHDYTRLKRISASEIPQTLIFDLFSHLNCLERISYHCSYQSTSFLTLFFQHLMDECSHLKHLKIKCHSSCIDLSPEMFRTLVSSKLISLKIIGPDIKPTSDRLFTTPINSLVNKTLRVLQIPVVINYHLQCLFIQSFERLKILQLQFWSGAVLESIGQYQKNLMILKLSLLSRSHSNMSEHGICLASKWRLCQVNNCLQSLTCLENLNLHLDHSYETFDFQFVPFSVKYLSICYSGSSYKLFSNAYTHLVLALKKKTKLEAIHFSLETGHLNNIAVWLEICCSLNKLHILSLNEFAPLPQASSVLDTVLEKSQTLCECCPSLRYFAHTVYDKSTVLEYDYVNQKMKGIDDGDLMVKFFTADRIADTKVKFLLIND